MPHAKVIIGAFAPVGKTAQAVGLPQGVEPVRPSGKNFVGIGLMAHVPDYFVAFGIKDRQHGQGQFHHAERRSKMPARAGNRFHQRGAQFSRELFENGIFGTSIGYPTVPKGKARIRVMISAAHSRDDLDQGLQAFARVGRKLGVIQ